MLIVFHDMIADMFSNKKFSPVVTELGKKLNMSLVFIAQSFAVPKNTWHNCCFNLNDGLIISSLIKFIYFLGN